MLYTKYIKNLMNLKKKILLYKVLEVVFLIV
jgi:hypothetical protein